MKRSDQKLKLNWKLDLIFLSHSNATFLLLPPQNWILSILSPENFTSDISLLSHSFEALKARSFEHSNGWKCDQCIRTHSNSFPVRAAIFGIARVLIKSLAVVWLLLLLLRY